MPNPARKIVSPLLPSGRFDYDDFDIVDELQEANRFDPTGSIAAWHTVTPRATIGGRVSKSPTDDAGLDDL